eukprot:scaffold17463_cov66-Phaeocystis_antarctica.AAC.2
MRACRLEQVVHVQQPVRARPYSPHTRPYRRTHRAPPKRFTPAPTTPKALPRQRPAPPPKSVCEMKEDEGESTPRRSSAPSHSSSAPPSAPPGTEVGALPLRHARTTSDLQRSVSTSSRQVGAVSVGVNGPEKRSPVSSLPPTIVSRSRARSGPFWKMFKLTRAPVEPRAAVASTRPRLATGAGALAAGAVDLATPASSIADRITPARGRKKIVPSKSEGNRSSLRCLVAARRHARERSVRYVLVQVTDLPRSVPTAARPAARPSRHGPCARRLRQTGRRRAACSSTIAKQQAQLQNAVHS